MLNALIVDDEELGAKTLETLLKMHCSSVNVLGIANSADDAEKSIAGALPDVVFLDIEMPFANGFDLLQRFKNHPFEVIFTTAYNEYAVKAIKHNALDYLLKPIVPEELVAAVKKCEEKKNTALPSYKNPALSADRLEKIISTLSQKVHKLPVPSPEGIVYLDPDNIVYLQGDINYTHIHLIQGNKITSSKTLKDFEQLLPSKQFFRIHKANIINLSYVSKYLKGDGGEVVMSEGSSLEVSRNKKTELLALLAP
jgi:two-component system, LytTR family, response regulator